MRLPKPIDIVVDILLYVYVSSHKYSDSKYRHKLLPGSGPGGRLHVSYMTPPLGPHTAKKRNMQRQVSSCCNSMATNLGFSSSPTPRACLGQAAAPQCPFYFIVPLTYFSPISPKHLSAIPASVPVLLKILWGFPLPSDLSHHSTLSALTFTDEETCRGKWFA